MGRKSKQEKDLQSYWEEKLQKADLGMERGRHSGISYVGGIKGLESAENSPPKPVMETKTILPDTQTNISPAKCKTYKPSVSKKTL